MLAAWDGRADIDSRGEVLWREYWRQVDAKPWTIPFDANDPVMTPRGYDGSAAIVLTALTTAVNDLRGKGIPLDVPLGAAAGRAARE